MLIDPDNPRDSRAQRRPDRWSRGAAQFRGIIASIEAPEAGLAEETAARSGSNEDGQTDSNRADE
jgi:hypothetical protein